MGKIKSIIILFVWKCLISDFFLYAKNYLNKYLKDIFGKIYSLSKIKKKHFKISKMTNLINWIKV